VDVCVIGSGPSGVIAAAVLAQSGQRVLLLEEGTAPQAGDSLASMEPGWEPALAWNKGGGLAAVGRPWSACGLGGGMSVFAGLAFRFRHVDFDAAAYAGAGAMDPSWPIRYPDLRPYYDEIERAIGVARLAGSDPVEPEAMLPRMPPHPYSAAGGLLADAGFRLGMRPFPTPLAINPVAYRGRPACHRCGPCNEYVCPTGAKANAAGLFLGPLLRAGSLALRTESRALRVVLAGSHRAAGIEWLDLHTRQRHLTRARVIVVAANAVQSAAILLRSACRQAPRGLGNHGDMLGRGLSFKVSKYLSGTVQYLKQAARPGGPHSTVSFTDHYLDPAAPTGLGGLIYEASPQDRTVRGRRVRLRLHCLAADQPMPANRVLLGPGTAANGAPGLVMDYRTHRVDAARLKYLTCQARRILREAGAADITEEPSGYQLGSRHLHGTCRAGTDPRASVTDPWGLVHGTDNVYVVDGGFFPYAGGVNPVLTIQANALRISAEIARRLGTPRTGALAPELTPAN
jgi:paromamine 6'-oxidase/6'''-hydroxyneomycin C oxidase/2'-deamino-2'-hydroxyparomamine 6'-oxidase